MAGITTMALVQRDGTLSIPINAQKTLGLHEGDKVEVTVNVNNNHIVESSDDPLLSIIGMGKGGPLDGAENHDHRLYRFQTA